MAPNPPRCTEYLAVDANNNCVACISKLACKWSLLGYIQKHCGYGRLVRARYYQVLFQNGYRPPYGYIDKQLSDDEFNFLLSEFENLYNS